MADGVLFYRFAALDRPELLHGISLRHGGASHGTITGLNLGHSVGDDPAAVEQNHLLLYTSLGLAPLQVVSAQQVHGAHVERVYASHGGAVLPSTDALITNEPGIALLMRYADCVPVLLYDPVRGAIGLAHAGWRGALARVAARTAERMMGAFASDPADILACVGPSIGPCCYQVGPEVVAEARIAFPGLEGLTVRERPSGHAYLDLWRVVAEQLRQVGVRHISLARICTACRTDLFYSYRREHDRAGRFAAVIGLRGTGV